MEGEEKEEAEEEILNIGLTRGNWLPASSKGVLLAWLCESYKVKDRKCLMIPVSQLRPGTKGRSGGLNVGLVIAHFATMNYRPVCTKGAFL